MKRECFFARGHVCLHAWLHVYLSMDQTHMITEAGLSAEGRKKKKPSHLHFSYVKCAVYDSM